MPNRYARIIAKRGKHTCETHCPHEEYCRHDTSHERSSSACVYATGITGNDPLAASLRLWTLCSHSCSAIRPRAEPMAYAHCAKTASSHVGPFVCCGTFVLLLVCRQRPTISACPRVLRAAACQSRPMWPCWPWHLQAALQLDRSDVGPAKACMGEFAWPSRQAALPPMAGNAANESSVLRRSCRVQHKFYRQRPDADLFVNKRISKPPAPCQILQNACSMHLRECHLHRTMNSHGSDE